MISIGLQVPNLPSCGDSPIFGSENPALEMTHVRLESSSIWFMFFGWIHIQKNTLTFANVVTYPSQLLLWLKDF